MVKRNVCLYCNKVSSWGKPICTRCGYYMSVVKVPFTTFGILTYILIVTTIFLFILAWVPVASRFINKTIGGLFFCTLPILTMVFAAVFAYMDEAKKEKVALEMARKNYYAQYTQQSISLQQARPVPQPYRSSKQKKRSEIEPPKSKKTKLWPPPPPPPPPEE